MRLKKPHFMKARIGAYISLGLLFALGFHFKLLTIPLIQIVLSGPLEAKEDYSGTIVTLSRSQAFSLAQALHFDGQTYGCDAGDESWHLHPTSGNGFSLNIQTDCMTIFRGWVNNHGLTGNIGHIFKELISQNPKRQEKLSETAKFRRKLAAMASKEHQNGSPMTEPGLQIIQDAINSLSSTDYSAWEQAQWLPCVYTQTGAVKTNSILLRNILAAKQLKLERKKLGGREMSKEVMRLFKLTWRSCLERTKMSDSGKNSMTKMLDEVWSSY